ncbi:hypothetical protein, partial [Ligilactobacillus animalis]|uniref:hypothetical protein n=1 Tax=Ligilactobacillus animalis TaxID=1605 RepID=UPI003CF276BB
GGLTVNGGSLIAGSAGALGSGAIGLAAGTSLGLQAGVTLNNNIALNGAAGLDISTGAAIASGVISGGFGLSKTGAGA